jgi:hypothetical protein
VANSFSPGWERCLSSASRGSAEGVHVHDLPQRHFLGAQIGPLRGIDLAVRQPRRQVPSLEALLAFHAVRDALRRKTR